MSNRLIVALDTSDLHQALRWAEALWPHCGMFKVGLELFCSAGADAIHEVACYRPVMLDLKLHDVPTTVERTVRVLARHRPAWLTVHAGGRSMLLAATAIPRAERPAIMAVTELTSQGDVGIQAAVLRVARRALDAGADGLVCSPRDANMLRIDSDNRALLVCPGVRPTGSSDDDHARPMTPAQALTEGADWLVVGRPITQAVDPVAAARSLESLWSERREP